MNPANRDQLEQFITESFPEGVTRRELRLSTQEMAYLRERFPRTQFKAFTGNEYTDNKTWFEVQLCR